MKKAKYFVYGLVLVISLLELSSCKQSIDYKEASDEQLQSLADEGDVKAMVQLGKNALFNHDYDFDTAIKYFQMAADNGDATGLYNLTFIKPFANREHNVNVQELMEGFKEAGELGSTRSQAVYALYLIQEGMKGNSENLERGIEICQELLKKHEDAIAYWVLAKGLIAKYGIREKQEGDVIDNYYVKSIELGNGLALTEYVDMFIRGGDTKDCILNEIDKWKSQYPIEYEFIKNYLESGEYVYDSPDIENGNYQIKYFIE